MAKRGNPNWTKGVSGNPNGRPKKERALTAMLERAGTAGTEHEGKRISGKRLLAVRLWELVKTGRTEFEGGSVITVEDSDDFMAIAKFLYQHIDGPPPTNIELTGEDGGPIEHKIREIVVEMPPDEPMAD